MMFKIILNYSSLSILLLCSECYKDIDISCLQAMFVFILVYLTMLKVTQNRPTSSEIGNSVHKCRMWPAIIYCIILSHSMIKNNLT
jgi:uncharacterized membrane protein